jgi:hypothetical protein
VVVKHLCITIAVLVLSALAFAKDKPWQDAKVIANSLNGGFWVRGADNTYVLKPSKIRLTLGGPVRAYSDGKNLYVIDNEGKERKCQIVREMTNAAANQYFAREAAKTPEQRAAEKDAYEENLLRQQQLRQQVLRDWNAQQSKQKVEVQVKDCTKYPAACVQ